VYSWGAGDYGQLGHGIRWSVNTPRLVLDSNSIHLRGAEDGSGAGAGAGGGGRGTHPMSIACVAAGRYHSFALTSMCGVVWCDGLGWVGSGRWWRGPLGTLIMACVDRVVMCCADAGVLYGWGCNENGQLGVGGDNERKSSAAADLEDHVLLPTAVGSILGAVVGQVTCGEHHTCVLTCMSVTRVARFPSPSLTLPSPPLPLP
jgi:alpha-tubulin suppressor-like RCC1 family protein